MAGPSFQMENEIIAAGGGPVAGVDEVGRGPLAGPVAAAAVILDPDNLPTRVDDSKKLSARRREALFEEILSSALAVGVGFASVAEIEAINIREASLLAMRRAVGALAMRPGFALIDGNAIPKGLVCPARAVVRGDAACLSIAAASIVAKVMRDGLMARLHEKHPEYSFASNAGYGSAAHLAALAEYGASEWHRAGFAPVRAAIAARR